MQTSIQDPQNVTINIMGARLGKQTEVDYFEMQIFHTLTWFFDVQHTLD